MSPVQSTYNTAMPIGAAGLHLGEFFNIASGVFEASLDVLTLPFGFPVSKGTNEDQIKGAGAVAGFYGVSVIDRSIGGSQVDEYAAGQVAGYLKQGRIWVVAGEDGVAVNSPVYYNSTTGAWMKAAGSGLVGPIYGARFASAGDEGDLVILELSGLSQAAGIGTGPTGAAGPTGPTGA